MTPQRHRISCYCAFCKSPREIYGRKHMGILHLLSAAAVTYTISFLLLDNEQDFGVAFVFAFCCLITELAVQFRWRMSIVCPYCGFDPALYLRDAGKAVEKVKYTLKAREKDPRTLLSRRPRLDLPIRRPTAMNPGERLRAELRKQNAIAHIRDQSSQLN